MKTFELQITQTWHPKSVADGRTDRVGPLLDPLSLSNAGNNSNNYNHEDNIYVDQTMYINDFIA